MPGHKDQKLNNRDRPASQVMMRGKVSAQHKVFSFDWNGSQITWDRLQRIQTGDMPK